MRGRLPGVPSPFPLIERLPAVYQDDDFLRRFLAAFDESLAPLFLSLDGLGAYVDPELAPEDFLTWLATWVGIEVDAAWDVEQLRQVVAGAVRLHARRGTAAGLRAALGLLVDGEVVVTENGAAAWSTSFGADMPGDPVPRLHVRVTPRPGGSVRADRLEALVTELKPAHVPHTVEVVSS
ncbi:phage tail protein [Pseudactinotalea sp. HY158]|uniref:phage tail protein n=1 Tax=Pseudactinotalea sp. HY158 TaxID=2654547 RepID=UPI00129C6AA9|nr:phage tail protein [Pseudactinotalea sp. HY158]QGH68606.1 phage tail protein [Pseudactinotalea sp. HY158]